MSPRVTVAVATCGRPEALARCLAGLGDQDAPADEVLVVDQAASPEAREAARQRLRPAARRDRDGDARAHARRPAR